MLVSTSQASEILGISVQGVHYRIKKGLLKSQKQDGKTFVFITKDQKANPKTTQTNLNNHNDLIQAKEEQIELLKESIVWMKNQYISEISRLETNQEKIIDVFKSEIVLLQQAYNEMQTLLKIEDKTKSDSEVKENFEIQFIGVKEFFEIMQTHDKNKSQIKVMILRAIKNKDKRFIYNAQTKEILIYKSDFLDLI